MNPPTPEQIAQDVFDRFINRPVIINVFRAGHVEAMVARALGQAYELTPGWEAWDIQKKSTGLRIEIKQSAAKQTWLGHDASSNKKKTPPAFDIAPRQWQYIGTEAVQIVPPRRLADIYVFAWHGGMTDLCDHRDPRQWEFLVARATDLPEAQKTISLTSLTKVFGSDAWVCWERLLSEVDRAAKP